MTVFLLCCAEESMVLFLENKKLKINRIYKLPKR